MTIELLRYISIGAYVAAALFLVAAIIVFFALKIPSVIGDLTGRTAKKAIENIRNRNESTGEKRYKPSTKNIIRGKLTEKIDSDGSMQKRVDVSSPGFMTQKISTMKLDADDGETTVLSEDTGNETTVLGRDNNETTVLSGSNGETTVLGSNETTVLNVGRNETTVLNDSMPEKGMTTQLAAKGNDTEACNNQIDGEVKVIADLMFTQSTEIVE